MSSEEQTPFPSLGDGDGDNQGRNSSSHTQRTSFAVPPDRHGSASPLPPSSSPPPYGDRIGRVGAGQGQTGASITADGRVNIRISQDTKGLSSLLVPALRSRLDLTHLSPDDLSGAPPPYVPPELERRQDRFAPPALNLVIHVVGSRGDVQPFVALSKVLQSDHGHRVRLATHPVFKDFVEENGLEFFSIGGDPSNLMAYMVRNPGLMPGFDALRSGDIGNRRHEVAEMLSGCWRSCYETGDGMGADMSLYDPNDVSSQQGISSDTPQPFVADAIIANPPSFAHIHCAEKMGIPLHMMFTMPWSPTQAFPHPLANIQSTNAEGNLTNFMSYALVDMMTWQGLGDVINRFREKALGMEPISLTWAPGMLSRLHIPYTYCWSPALIPKPRDWGSYINISGFYFLSKSDSYTPDSDLKAFLDAGPPPLYIGFGSIVVDDPNAMTKTIFDAVKKSGQRALVSKGWGGFGADEIGIPEGVFMVGNVPHDWLFQHVSCVVHHGGAGTTAAGIACGRPTVVVPFFGDQPFWGAMVARAGIGSKPVHSKNLNADSLAEAIKEALKPGCLEKAKLLSERIGKERGAEVGAQSFHKQLDLDKMRCQLSPHRAAVWRIRRTDVRLSAFAAAVLSQKKLLDFKDLKLYRPTEYEPDDGPVEPISGGASALIETLTSMAMGVADMPVATLKALGIHPDAKRERSGSGVGSPSARSRAVSSATASGSASHNRGRSGTLSPNALKSALASPTRSDSGRSDEGTPASAQQIGAEMVASPTELPEDAAANLHITQSAAPSDAPSATPTNTGGRLRSDSEKTDWTTALRTGKGAAKITSAAVRSPMEFTLSLAKGFHNAPKLYGDDTVRKQEKITSFQSGLKAAGREFGYGFFDGISGLVTQPLQGAKKEGAAGFVKGFGKGIGGVVFKPGAAIMGLPGYTSMGIYREICKHFGPSVEGYVVASRTAQGYAEMLESTPEERTALAADWKEMRRFIRQRKNVGEEKMQEIQTRIRRYTASSARDVGATSPNPTRQALERTPTVDTMSSGVWSPEESKVVRNPLSRSASLQKEAPPVESAGSQADLEDELEEAIRRSVADTSKGDAKQDASIERAIRASLADIQERHAGGADDGELSQAMERSVREAREGGGEGGDSDAERRDLELAMAESRKTHEAGEAAQKQAADEEEVVMRYVMRQSDLERQAKEGKHAAEAEKKQG